MPSLGTPRNDVTVVIPQHLIDLALKDSGKSVAEVVAYDERTSTQQPLYMEEGVGPFGFGRLLLFGAIIGSLFIFSGFQVAQSHAPATVNQVAVSSGVQSMSAAELVQSISRYQRFGHEQIRR